MSETFDTFSGYIEGEVLEFNSDAIPKPDTLIITMTRGERRIVRELRDRFGAFKRVVIDVDGERHEFSADSLIRLLEGYEGSSSQECHATQPNYEHCKYSTNRGWCDTSRYAALFGTPERAAQTLQDMCNGSENCKDLRCPALQDTEAQCGNYKLLLEWLRGDA